MVGAERYYRTVVRGGPDAWNVRDRHMVETLQNLMARHGEGAKAVVWEHNTHIGDARATDMRPPVCSASVSSCASSTRTMGGAGRLRVLPGQRHRGKLVGRAEKAYGGAPGKTGELGGGLSPRRQKNALLVTETLPHEMTVRENSDIGVVYHPTGGGNYVPTSLAGRYDAFLYLDETEARWPLHAEPHPELHPGLHIDEPGVPETYPWGL